MLERKHPLCHFAYSGGTAGVHLTLARYDMSRPRWESDAIPVSPLFTIGNKWILSWCHFLRLFCVRFIKSCDNIPPPPLHFPTSRFPFSKDNYNVFRKIKVITL